MAPSLPSTTCLIHSDSGELTARVPCDSQYIFLTASNGGIQKVPHPCHVKPITSTSTHKFEDEVEDWQRWLASKLSKVLDTRDAAPEPEPGPETESELETEVMDAAHLVRRKSRPKTTGTTTSSATGKTVVGAVGLWVALGWVLAAAI